MKRDATRRYVKHQEGARRDKPPRAPQTAFQMPTDPALMSGTHQSRD
jgi:hypothetical protein